MRLFSWAVLGLTALYVGLHLLHMAVATAIPVTAISIDKGSCYSEGDGDMVCYDGGGSIRYYQHHFNCEEVASARNWRTHVPTVPVWLYASLLAVGYVLLGRKELFRAPARQQERVSQHFGTNSNNRRNQWLKTR